MCPLSYLVQHFHSSGNAPPFQSTQGPFIPRPPHSFYNKTTDIGSPYVPMTSPGTPHGENHSTSVPHGVYGPVGSNMPMSHSAKSHSLPNPHTPPPHSHLQNAGDVWMQPFAGPVGSHNRQGQPSSMNFPPRPPNFPPQGPPFHPSFGFGPGPSLNTPHMIQREMGQKPNPVGTHRAGRHGSSFDDQSHMSAHVTTHWGGGQKRWSVPGFTSTPRPAVPLHPVWSQQPPPGRGASFIPDQPLTDDGNRSQFLTGNGSLSLNDPWGPPPWSSLSLPKLPVSVRQTPPTSSLPPMSISFTPTSSTSKGSVPTSSDTWLTTSEVGGALVDRPTGGGDLQQLLKSLDINDEHAHALKVRL